MKNGPSEEIFADWTDKQTASLLFAMILLATLAMWVLLITKMQWYGLGAFLTTSPYYLLAVFMSIFTLNKKHVITVFFSMCTGVFMALLISVLTGKPAFWCFGLWAGISLLLVIIPNVIAYRKTGLVLPTEKELEQIETETETK